MLVCIMYICQIYRKKNIESYDAALKDDVSVMTVEVEQSVEILKKPLSKLELTKLMIYCEKRVITSYPVTNS